MPERPVLDLLRLVHPAPLAATAAREQVREVAAGALLFKLEFATATGLAAVDEVVPVDVVDVAAGGSL